MREQFNAQFNRKCRPWEVRSAVRSRAVFLCLSVLLSHSVSHTVLSTLPFLPISDIVEFDVPVRRVGGHGNLPQDLTRPRTVPRRRCLRTTPKQPALPRARGYPSSRIRTGKREYKARMGISSTSNFFRANFLRGSDDRESLTAASACGACGARGVSAASSGEKLTVERGSSQYIMLPPPVSRARPSLSLLLPVSPPLSFSSLPSRRELSPARHFHREYPGSAVCTSTPGPRTRRDDDADAEHRAFTSINTLGEPGRGEEQD